MIKKNSLEQIILTKIGKKALYLFIKKNNKQIKQKKDNFNFKLFLKFKKK